MAITAEKRATEKYRDEMGFQVKVCRGLGRLGERREETKLYREGVHICLDRARLITQSFKETEGEPIVLRRAKALAHILDNMTIWIGPQERIVGNFAADPDGVQHYPDLFVGWLDKAIDGPYKYMIDDAEREELHQIHEYWRNKCVHGSERSLLPEGVKPYWRFPNQGVFFWLHGGRTGVPNYDKVFKIGLNGFIKEAEDHLKEISSDPSIYLNSREYLEQKRFLEAAIIGLEAGIRWGKRYAAKAREMLGEEKDERRRRELEEIAEVCDWVPGNPPRTLHEAIQCYYFITLITRIIDLQTPGLGDRFDQIMYPLYKKDKEEGRLTPKQAQELVEYMLIKMNEFGELAPPIGAGGGGGVVTARVMTIGGQTPEGDDATNEMTYITLDAKNAMGLTQPAIAIRLHRNAPQEFLYKITEAHRIMPGVYSLFNDEMMIPYLMSLGIPIEDARNYSTEGCMRWIIPGRAMGMRALGGMFALPKCLEYALNQGMDKFSGKQVGARTPDPLAFTSIEDVIQAYLEQVRFFLEKLVTIYNIVDVLDEEWLPQPFLSALMDGCIERGQDCRKYKYFPNTIIQPVGQITVADSLAAMKKLVFEDKRITKLELLDALKNNWEGKEELRQMCINEAPKFGNDDDYVDLLARDVLLRTTQVFRGFKNIWGGPFMEDGTGGSSYFSFSGLTGATTDGRKDRDLFNDGTISPCIGMDKKGPTAVLKSVGKIDHARGFTQLLNQKFLPQYLEGDNKEAFASYLRTWVDLGIHHIQFNAVDRDILLDAQQHPGNHHYLVVRVAGYSAYFIDLDKEVQDQIIARTEQVLA